MRETAVALKYARALFDSAREDGNLGAVAEAMDSLYRLKVEDPAFLNFLISPEVLTEHKVAFIQVVFASRLDPLVANFLRLLVDKKRIAFLPEMCEEFARLHEEDRGDLRARVLTAVPLGPEQENRLKKELDRITGKNVQLEKSVDPSVLGGVIVHLGNKIIDRSLRRGIVRLRENLLHAEVN